MTTTDAGSAPLERVVRPRVLVADGDFARGNAALVFTLMRALEDGGIELVNERELRIEARPQITDCAPLAVPKAEPPTCGPQRKGRGGKLKRW